MGLDGNPPSAVPVQQRGDTISIEQQHPVACPYISLEGVTRRCAGWDNNTNALSTADGLPVQTHTHTQTLFSH